MFIQKVGLKGVKFYAFHGYYPEEQLIGSDFIIDLELCFTPYGERECLDQTVNYEELNEILRTRMAIPQKLLESVAKDIMADVLKRYNFLLKVDLNIYKCSPPMPGQVGQSVVGLQYQKNQHS